MIGEPVTLDALAALIDDQTRRLAIYVHPDLEAPVAEICDGLDWVKVYSSPIVARDQAIIIREPQQVARFEQTDWTWADLDWRPTA